MGEPARSIDLDMLKGVASAFVVGSHLTPMLGGETSLAQILFQPDLGVGGDLFFAAAGFLAIRGLRSGGEGASAWFAGAGRFYAARAARLAPLAWGVALVAAATGWAVGAPATWADIEAALAFSSNVHWAPCFAGTAGCGDPRTLGHFWWLGLLTQFIILAPVLALAPARWLRLAVPFALMVGAFTTRPWGGALWAFRPDSLLIGAWLAAELREGASVAWARRWGSIGVFEASWVMLVGAMIARLLDGFASGAALVFVACACGALVARAAVCERGWIGAADRAAAWVGARSYALYLVHPTVLGVARVALMPWAGFAVSAAVSVVVSLGCAAALTRLVDRRGAREALAPARA